MTRSTFNFARRVLGALLLSLVLAGLPSLALAQRAAPAPSAGEPVNPLASVPESKEGFYDIVQLERLFNVARESGFTEEAIREIKIEDEAGNIVNAWDYLQEIKRRRRLQDKVDADKVQRLYLTVQDILTEFRQKEADDLRKLREQTVFPD